MKEIVKIGTETFECTKVSTGINNITLTMPGSIDKLSEIYGAAKSSTSLTVSDSPDGMPYGIYDHLVFQSATIQTEYDDNNEAYDAVVITFHSPNETERKIAALEHSQAEQDEAIAEIMFGTIE